MMLFVVFYTSGIYLLILLIMCSVCVMNVVFAVKMYYLETTPPKWIQVFKILNNLMNEIRKDNWNSEYS